MRHKVDDDWLPDFLVFLEKESIKSPVRKRPDYNEWLEEFNEMLQKLEKMNAISKNAIMLDNFQLEFLESISAKLSSLALSLGDATLIFVYYALKKVIDKVKKQNLQAREPQEQLDYSYPGLGETPNSMLY
jgi:hypothetical protein